ncbi:MAG: hypothetical protein IPM45_17730 [Acidimicrobiales bacterium]|nr:hypothetical protein [Acidimicrobiales bacterium]
MELRRRRFGCAVRLEVDHGAVSPEICELLVRRLDLDDDDVFEHGAPLDLSQACGRCALQPRGPKTSRGHP